MHELSIVEALIDQVESEVRASGHRGRVLGLDLSVGRLSGAHADSLRFAFQLLAPDSLVADAELRITEPGARCRCLDCEVSSEINELVANCPCCDSPNVRIEGGQDLLLEAIDLED